MRWLELCCAGTWQVWAGRCGPEYAGYQDGIRHAARFRQPGSICISAAGYLIVADAGNFCLRAITPEGQVTTYAGVCNTAGYVDGLADEAMFSTISDVQCLANCSVLVAEPSSGRIRLVVDSSSKCPAVPGKTGAWLAHHKVWAAVIPVFVIASLIAAATAAVWAQEHVAQLWARMLDRTEQSSELVQDNPHRSRPVGLRDTGNTGTAHQGMPEQQSFGARLGAMCARWWPAARLAHGAIAAGDVDFERGHQPQDLAETTRLAGQDTAEILRAKQVSRRQQSTSGEERFQQSASPSDDVFNLFDGPDASNQTANAE